MKIEVVHRPEAGAKPFFLVAVLRGKEITDGGYATAEEAEAARRDFAACLRGAFA